MTYSDWRVELSEKYKVFKGLYKIIKTPTVIKAAPKQKLKNAVGISYKKSMGTLDYRRSIFPDYKANRSNRFARIKATPSGDPMADISQNIYKKEGKKSLERRLAAKEKQRQEWLKANNLPSSSSAQPPHFNEGVAALALKGGSKLIPALMTGIGAAGTIMQAKRKYRTRLNPGKRNSGRVLSPAEKKIFDKSQRDTDQKVTDQKPRDKVVKKILDRNAKKNQERMKTPNRIQSDRRRLLRGMAKGEVMLDQYSPTNNVGGGQIAGTVEAGDNPPVKKKKRYIYGGAGSRKMWMNNK
jgi:hypothetical protein